MDLKYENYSKSLKTIQLYQLYYILKLYHKQIIYLLKKYPSTFLLVIPKIDENINPYKQPIFIFVRPKHIFQI